MKPYRDLAHHACCIFFQARWYDFLFTQSHIICTIKATFQPCHRKTAIEKSNHFENVVKKQARACMFKTIKSKCAIMCHASKKITACLISPTHPNVSISILKNCFKIFTNQRNLGNFSFLACKILKAFCQFFRFLLK